MLNVEASQKSCAFSFGQDERDLVIESTSANEVRGFKMIERKPQSLVSFWL